MSEKELSDIVQGSVLDTNEIQQYGLQYRFVWGYDSPVYKDKESNLYMLDKIDEHEYRVLAIAEKGSNYLK